MCLFPPVLHWKTNFGSDLLRPLQLCHPGQRNAGHCYVVLSQTGTCTGGVASCWSSAKTDWELAVHGAAAQCFVVLRQVGSSQLPTLGCVRMGVLLHGAAVQCFAVLRQVGSSQLPTFCCVDGCAARLCCAMFCCSKTG
eukprot:TRINITY_DN14124_c0_g1_i5.p1 TRINITY_DN14124_c0_g1~~TRINITY_DN14124_c0_g1_i5.p1  ORF type:complete len:139 (+),score=20.50 TRINITY_DN14124_c0_g1_i5:211-627(+)